MAVLNPCGCNDGGGGPVQITTGNVTYNGADAPCTPLINGDNLTGILLKIDGKLCEISGDLSNYYTKTETDAILLDYAKLTDLLISGQVSGTNLVLNNSSGPAFNIDATPFLAQGTVLSYVGDTLALINDAGTTLSSVQLPGTHFRGEFISEAALIAAIPTGNPGDYANVDFAGGDVTRYIWDNTDSQWVEQAGSGGGITSVNSDVGPAVQLDLTFTGGQLGLTGTTAVNLDTRYYLNTNPDGYITAADIPEAQTLSLGATAGNIAISGGNNVSLNSITRRSVTDYAAFTGTNGLYPYFVTNGSGYPDGVTQNGTGISIQGATPGSSFAFFKPTNLTDLYFGPNDDPLLWVRLATDADIPTPQDLESVTNEGNTTGSNALFVTGFSNGFGQEGLGITHSPGTGSALHAYVGGTDVSALTMYNNHTALGKRITATEVNWIAIRPQTATDSAVIFTNDAVAFTPNLRASGAPGINPNDFATMSQLGASVTPSLQAVTTVGNVTDRVIRITDFINTGSGDGMRMLHTPGTNSRITSTISGAIIGSLELSISGANLLGTGGSNLLLRTETAANSSALFSGRVSGQNAINNNEFPTLGQVMALINP